jgi:phage terminase Nu1 subunit (DNA packaging protein)
MSKDKGLTWPAEKMAKFIDISPRRLQQLVQEGIIPKEDRGRYSPIAVNLAYIRYLRDRVQSPAQSGNELAAAKLAKLKAEREQIELDMEIKRRLRIPIDDALEVHNRVFQAIAGTLKANRDKLLTENQINEMLTALRDAGARMTTSANGA